MALTHSDFEASESALKCQRLLAVVTLKCVLWKDDSSTERQ